MKLNSWYAKSKNITIEKKDKEIIIKNNGEKDGIVFNNKILRFNSQYANINFEGVILEGSGALLSLLNRKKERIMDVIFNSKTSSYHKIGGFILPIIIIKGKTTIKINIPELSIGKEKEVTFNKYLGGSDILVITPSYPSPDNLYACGFVHSRIRAYQEAGMNVDVASVWNNNISSSYSIDGVNVFKTDYTDLRNILMGKHYKAILVHFLDETYAEYLDTSYLNDTPVFLWNHGADVLYWDYKEFTTPYFKDDCNLSSTIMKQYHKRDIYFKKFAKDKRFNWIFVSNWEKQRAEELLNTTFNNSIVISNPIDTNIFSYDKKDVEKRKKIFMVRKFDNTKKYAVDIVVLTILELSRRSFFNELEFYICGEGFFHEELISPIKKFSNVHIINNFLSHKQIKQMHDECGIGLFPTRQDTQGVSALEAASSGLAVVTSQLEVLYEYFDESLNTLCPIEDYKSYADVIERLYNSPKEFLNVSEKMAKHTRKLCSHEKTISEEIEFINKYKLDYSKLIYPIKEINDNPILTVAIPSYNAEKYLDKCLLSLLKSKYSHMTEILVINDGSKDNTKEIGLLFEKLTTVGKKSIVKLIDKQNGGHGSGVNKGIELAKGKYFKVVDSDDWVDFEDYELLLKKLIEEDTDMILCDYSEARTYSKTIVKKSYYNFLPENAVYNLNDISIGAYGFQEWGPCLPTATYKVECLRKTDFKLPEHTFYVDMLYNAYSIININTVKRLNLDIYRYYIGNVGQSISQAGMMKNYKHHENVILDLMKIISTDDRLTFEKREFILHKLLLPMVNVQYYINIELFNSREKLMKFEKRIKNYPALLNYPEFNKNRVKFHRYTKGYLVKFHPILSKIANVLRKVKN